MRYYQDEQGDLHPIVEVEDSKPEKSPWMKSFYVRPWVVFVVIILAGVLFIANGISNSNKKMKQDQAYADCIRSQFPYGDASVCDHLK